MFSTITDPLIAKLLRKKKPKMFRILNKGLSNQIKSNQIKSNQIKSNRSSNDGNLLQLATKIWGLLKLVFLVAKTQFL